MLRRYIIFILINLYNMAKHRHQSQKGGSGNYSSAATYAEYVNGSMPEQYARVFDQTGANAANQSNVIVGAQGQWSQQPGVPSAQSLTLVQSAGKRTRSASRARSASRGRSASRARSASRGRTASRARGASRGRTASRARSASRSAARARSASRGKSGGLFGSVINQAIVPFSLLAMQQSYRKKGGRKTMKRGGI